MTGVSHVVDSKLTELAIAVEVNKRLDLPACLSRVVRPADDIVGHHAGFVSVKSRRAGVAIGTLRGFIERGPPITPVRVKVDPCEVQLGAPFGSDIPIHSFFPSVGTSCRFFRHIRECS